MKKCPYCARDIHDEAIRCPYCGGMLPESPTQSVKTEPSDDLEVEVSRLMKMDRKVQAIRLVRQKNGLSLPDAVAYVERFGGVRPAESPEDDR